MINSIDIIGYRSQGALSHIMDNDLRSPLLFSTLLALVAMFRSFGQSITRRQESQQLGASSHVERGFPC
jgi:hypothetical protein